MSKVPEQREKVIAFVVARLSSSRLPAKQLRKIGEKSVIQWTLEQLEQSTEIDQTVIATVAEEENIPLKDFATTCGIECYWYQGEVDHVTNRLRTAAEQYDADICLLISGDCPLISAAAIDYAVQEFRTNSDAEVAAFAPQGDRTCMLEGVHIVRKRAWQRADDLSVRPEQKEHQFPVMGQQPHLFSWLPIDLPPQYYARHHRLSVDTPADLEFMNTLHRRLTQQHLAFNLENILELLEQQPQLKKINSHVYQRKLIEENNRALFIIDAGSPYGRGHLMRCSELAKQLIEGHGWSVTFLLDDQEGTNYLEAQGFRTQWGAFGRSVKKGQDTTTVSVSAAAVQCSLVVIDIFDQRTPKQGWRHALTTGQAVVSLGNRQKWSSECDLIIMPRPAVEKYNEHENLPPTLSGPDYLILRHSVWSKTRKASKDLDLLVYLHDTDLRAPINVCADKLGLSCIFIGGFNKQLPELMRQARFFLSGFGVSSYEALSLNTYPLCWPHSEINRDDALKFYAAFELQQGLVENIDQLEKTLKILLDGDDITLPEINNGSARIIEILLEKARQKTKNKLCGHEL